MKPVRCAIYTRKSSEEGLEQDFNSLHAQREACAAYIASQASEGWALLPGAYDDGGISGGTLERPALKQLLADIGAGLIDIVVVYKVDRLTRSLLDFAKLVEAFDKAGTSFVSITQSFNTTTSMGRLTLNMLLSFAQFEREVTAERIRDKLAASKAKGMWMGGMPPLGYRADGRTLAIVEPHAALVRDIYARYRTLGNARRVAEELASEGIRSPIRTTAKGRTYGGSPFSSGQIAAILKNPIYTGMIAHKGQVFKGLHKQLVAPEYWEAVQAQISSNTQGSRKGPRSSGMSPLARILFDETGDRMIGTHTCRGEKKYRYYVTSHLHHLTSRKGQAGMRIPAAELEAVIANELAHVFDDPLGLANRASLDLSRANLQHAIDRCKEAAGKLRYSGLGPFDGLLSRIDVHSTKIRIKVSTQAVGNLLDIPLMPSASTHFLLSRAMQLIRTGRAMRLINENHSHAGSTSCDPSLIAQVLKGREWWSILARGDKGPVDLARHLGVSLSYITRTVRLAFLSPAVVEGMVNGRLKPGTCGAMLMKKGAIPPSWREQEDRFLV